MFIVLREQFHDGWTLWLGTAEDANLAPAPKAAFPGLPFEKKVERLFRLTVWANSAKKRDLEAKYSTDIPGGAEVFISRVTGLKLYPDSPAPDQMAQGNAARVELVTKIDLNSDGDDDSTTDQPLAATSQGTEGNVTDRDRPTPKKRARVTGKQQAGPDENKKTRSTASKQEKLP
ncbi:hypothetical protein ON010_g15876 [Phytophthora cinnamomi]|nr:hypothetical protein ON010_g15876 [Phytophthora cinnamomi]